MREVDWQSCNSMSETHEIEALERWCKEQWELEGGDRDLRALEIGSFQGKTACCMAQYSIVMCVDLFSNVDDSEGSPNGIGEQPHYLEYIRNVKRLGLVDRVFPIIGSSDVLRFFPNLNLDIIFIDGSHYEKYVTKDINNSIRHLGKNGKLMLHDFRRSGWGFCYPDGSPPDHSPLGHDPWGGVNIAVTALLEQGEFVIHEHYAGIVALKRA